MQLKNLNNIGGNKMNNYLIPTIAGVSIISATMIGLSVRKDILADREAKERREHELAMEKARLDKELEEKKIIASYPDSYWEAKKAEAEEVTKQIQIKCDAEIKLELEKLKVEKEMPEGYFTRDAIVKKAEEERKAAQYAADKEAEIKEKEAKAAAMEAEANRKHEEQLANNERKKLTDMARENRWAVEAMTGAVARALK